MQYNLWLLLYVAWFSSSVGFETGSSIAQAGLFILLPPHAKC